MNEEIVLTDQQQEALEEVLEWFQDKDGPQFKSLRGYAGTGKTTLLHFISEGVKDLPADELFSSNRVAITATTNKAVKVLKEMVQGDHYGTIHSLLNIKPYQYGRKEIFKPDYNSDNNINAFQLVIIDECSMVSSVDKGKKAEERSLLSLIKDSTRDNVKVLFCGDPAQLQPINETKSATFNYEPSDLTDVVRHASSIAKKAKLVRNRKSVTELEELLSGDDIVKVNRSEVDGYFEGFRDNPDQCRMLCWTNKAVHSWNTQLRLADFGQPMPVFTPGDIVMANSPCMVLRPSGNYEIVMANSQEGIVQHVEEKEHEFILTVDVIAEEPKQVELCVVKESYQPSLDDILEDLAEERNWERYWTLKKKYHDVRHCYSLTTHKSQGSTFDRVILDWNNINKNPDIENRNQLIYVAMTRAAKQVLIYV